VHGAVQWRRSVTLDETCTLLADVQTLVDIPPRIQKLVRFAVILRQASSAGSYTASPRLPSLFTEDGPYSAGPGELRTS
jgi:hypothetical protein